MSEITGCIYWAPLEVLCFGQHVPLVYPRLGGCFVVSFGRLELRLVQSSAF